MSEPNLSIKIYLDNCCYGRPYDDQTQIHISLEAQSKLAIQQLVSEGHLELSASFLNTYENEGRKDEDAKKHIAQFINENIIDYVDESEKDEMKPLIDEIVSTGIKPIDATHVAAAIRSNCDYFITTDDRILKYSTDRIKIVNPAQFMTIER